MENKKTISDLNSKAWYRLLKVFFGLGFLIVLVGFNIIAFSSGIKSVDQDKTTVECFYGDKKVLTAKSINLYLSNNDFVNGQFDYKNYFEGYNDYQIKNIFESCYQKLPGATTDVFAIQKIYEVWGKDRILTKADERAPLTQDEINYLDTVTKQISNTYSNTEKAKFLDFSVKLFDIKPIFTYNPFLMLFLIGNFIILFIFEAMRRIFYYIVLGNLKPKK